MAQWVYEMKGGKPYGYFSGKYLYTERGECTHYRGGNDDRYLFTMKGECEFYQQDRYFYEMRGGRCRWYVSS